MNCGEVMDKDTKSKEEQKMSVRVKRVSLCDSRHLFPEEVQGSIYSHTIDLDRPKAIESRADMYVCQAICDGFVELDVYVTGVQRALVAVINACHRRGMKLVLWHFNPKSEQYESQEVL